MKYIIIDGDDVGRKITSCYISNNVKKLQSIIKSLEFSTKDISGLLQSWKFDVIFCAADGVVASIGDENIEFDNLFFEINQLASVNILFSAGVGSNLQEAYIALLAAKSNGKNRLCQYSEIKFSEKEKADKNVQDSEI